jgi:hypothetical protein
MGKARVTKRSKVKPFIKVVNYNHIMPTRYTLELEGLKGVVSNETFGEVSQREEAKKTVKKTLEERYLSGKNRWFFTPLREYTCKIEGGGWDTDCSQGSKRVILCKAGGKDSGCASAHGITALKITACGAHDSGVNEVLLDT